MAETYKFLVDMNVSPVTVDFLKRLGYNAVRVNEALTPIADDISIRHRSLPIIKQIQ